MLYNYLFVQELGAGEDYLINFVMQISHGVYLTAPFVKTDLILIFPGRLKKMLLPVLASEGLRVSKLIFQAPGKQLCKENKTKNTSTRTAVFI